SHEAVRVRIALGDPNGRQAAERSEEAGIEEAIPAEICNALALYRPLAEVGNIEIRLHHAVLYNSIYRADERFIVNQHAYGIPAAHSPLFGLTRTGAGDMTDAYLRSFGHIWDGAWQLRWLTIETAATGQLCCELSQGQSTASRRSMYQLLAQGHGKV